MKSFTIQHPLTTLNEYIKVERANKFKAAALKKKLTKCALYASALPKIEGLNHYVFVHTLTNRRTDPDNHLIKTKFVMDGLVKVGRIENDGFSQVGIILQNFRFGKKAETEVLILNSYELLKYITNEIQPLLCSEGSFPRP